MLVGALGRARVLDAFDAGLELCREVSRGLSRDDVDFTVLKSGQLRLSVRDDADSDRFVLRRRAPGVLRVCRQRGVAVCLVDVGDRVSTGTKELLGLVRRVAELVVLLNDVETGARNS